MGRAPIEKAPFAGYFKIQVNGFMSDFPGLHFFASNDDGIIARPSILDSDTRSISKSTSIWHHFTFSVPILWPVVQKSPYEDLNS